MPDYIPPRLRYSAFADFAPILGYVLRNWPHAVEIDPGSITPDTCARRLRECRQAKLEYCHAHADVDELQWKAHGEQIVVTVVAGKVVAGPRGAVATKQITTRAGTVTPDIHEVRVNPDYLETICVLFTTRALTPRPANFVVSGPIADKLKELEAHYDVAFAPAGPEKWSII